MSSYTSQYRKDHPEWREAEKIRNNEREKTKYNNDPEYKEQVKKRALERYYRMKEAKLNASIFFS
jgi:hypothetical protein